MLLLEPRHEMTHWQVVMAMLTRAWVKLSNSPPELAESLMALHALWWGFGLTLQGYAINPERASLLNGRTEHIWGAAFILIALLKFTAVVIDLASDTMRFRLAAGVLLLSAWALVTSQFAGPTVNTWINSATINYSGLMLLQMPICTRQFALAIDGWRKQRGRHGLA